MICGICGRSLATTVEARSKDTYASWFVLLSLEECSWQAGESESFGAATSCTHREKRPLHLITMLSDDEGIV